jgi:hypothetical protein
VTLEELRRNPIFIPAAAHFFLPLQMREGCLDHAEKSAPGKLVPARVGRDEMQFL